MPGPRTVSKRFGPSLGFDTLRLEGALLLPDLLEKAAQGQASAQQPEDYHVPRVLELSYTTHDLKPRAEALGHDGRPFPFDPDHRAWLRAELDAYYARLYALTREDLCYILDPTSVMGEDYPSETFRMLKQNEEREFGEYRVQRLVLDAWDRLHAAEPTPPVHGAIE